MDPEFTSARQVADDPRVLAFGQLQSAANRLGYLLGRALERECGITHLTYEVLLLVGRAGEDGLTMRSIAQEQVLTTGGATRLVDRMEALGLVTRTAAPDDRRGRLVRLTSLGEETAVRAGRLHVEHIEQFFSRPLPGDHRERFAEDLRTVSHFARDALPRLR
ncbi:MarR family transcriptional regulator [Amycolatopsis sp. A133]|uniref:MarR family winged helix-turn-helix transcriptional regulator n=1 Tax=Amycolatopsis sp. A133 TaxID=3064472 RepID=UPI0027F8DEA9|nr:MarR family transcriptional regulator [Amycolatopsis sp. A133]MDQ7804361.1 MarR family transcriptional regulator [Amycolatopsis sp. A133]